MFNDLTPEENDAWRAAMLRGVVQASKLASFVVGVPELWEPVYGVLCDCNATIQELCAAI